MKASRSLRLKKQDRRRKQPDRNRYPSHTGSKGPEARRVEDQRRLKLSCDWFTEKQHWRVLPRRIQEVSVRIHPKARPVGLWSRTRHSPEFQGKRVHRHPWKTKHPAKDPGPDLFMGISKVVLWFKSDVRWAILTVVRGVISKNSWLTASGVTSAGSKAPAPRSLSRRKAKASGDKQPWKKRPGKYPGLNVLWESSPGPKSCGIKAPAAGEIWKVEMRNET